MQDDEGNTALHRAFLSHDPEEAVARKAHLLLQAGGSPLKINNDGETPLALVQFYHPDYLPFTVLLEQALAEAEKASLLVKARRLAVAANSNSVAPSCLQARMARGQTLPRVVLMPLAGGNKRTRERRRTRRGLVGFLLGMEDGPKGGGHAAGRASGGDGPANAVVGPATAQEGRHGGAGGAGLSKRKGGKGGGKG